MRERDPAPGDPVLRASTFTAMEMIKVPFRSTRPQTARSITKSGLELAVPDEPETLAPKSVGRLIFEISLAALVGMQAIGHLLRRQKIDILRGELHHTRAQSDGAIQDLNQQVRILNGKVAALEKKATDPVGTDGSTALPLKSPTPPQKRTRKKSQTKPPASA